MSKLFKPYLEDAITYKGGKGKGIVNGSGINEIIKLSSNENLIGSSPMALEAIQQSMTSLNEYPDGNANRLCDALAKYYANELTADRFVCANSGSECIEMVARAFLDEESECIISTPTFMPYLIFSKKTGAKVVDIPLKSESYDIDIPSIIDAVNAKTKLIFVTNPNNPTGAYIPDNQIETLLQSIPDDVIVVIDEVYRQFVQRDDYSEAHKWISEGYNVIGINSFSKAYGLAGLRIGYMYAGERVAHYINKLSRPFFLNTLALNAAIAALSDVAFIEQTQAYVNAGKAYLYDCFNQIGLKYWKSDANFILVEPKKINDVNLVESLQQKNIMVRPVSNFGATGCVRITIGKQRDNEALANAIREIYV